MALQFCFQLILLVVTATRRQVGANVLNDEHHGDLESFGESSIDLNEDHKYDFPPEEPPSPNHIFVPTVDKRMWQKSSLKAWGKRNEDSLMIGYKGEAHLPMRNKQNLIRAWGKKNSNSLGSFDREDVASLGWNGDGGDYGDGDDDAAADDKNNHDAVAEDKRSGWKKNRLKIWGKRSSEPNHGYPPINHHRPITFGGQKRSWQNNILRLWG